MRITRQMLGIIAFMLFITEATSAANMPQRGQHMNTVKSTFGPPVNQYDAVGQPPITRWDYEEFSVYFEHSTVVHSVDHSKALIPMHVQENRPTAATPSAPAANKPAASKNDATAPVDDANNTQDQYRYDTATGRMVPAK